MSEDALRRHEFLQRLGSGALLERKCAQHREDFEAGRVSSAHGWVLSLTEARPCATERFPNG